MAQTILEMAKDLVMAQIQAGTLSSEDMYRELQKVYACLMELKAKEEAGVAFGAPGAAPGALAADGRKTAEVPDWRRSIKKHTIECLECGAQFKQLSVRHLKEHGLDPRSYRAKYGMPRTQPLSAKETTATRKRIVQKSRPWEKAPTYLKAQAQKSEEAAAAKAGTGKKK
ncbi:MAG: transcriptional regulator [Candidatus Tectimicrobiota bacterium]|nr:MAG: transcriptional regulator [Candidatus Tectomicrobia bacterium]